MTLSRFAKLTAFATFCLLIAGGLVTSTNSGLAVPDWPLSYGTLFPPMVGGVRFEHTHRVIAGLVAILIAVLAFWLRRSEPRPWVRQLGMAALGAVIAQALLGGLTVLLLLPPMVSVAHACLAQTVFCLVVSVALVTSSMWQRADEPIVDADRLRRITRALTAIVFVQLLLGAIIRHSGLGIPWHIAGAVVVSIMAIVAVKRAKRSGSRRLFRAGLILAHAIAAQIILGPLILIIGRYPLLTTAHVAVGASTLATACVMAWLAWRAQPAEVATLSTEKLAGQPA